MLVLLGEEPGAGPDLLVLQRAATLRNHAGQPAFPGGAADPGDADPAATALREATEEVGLDPRSVTVLAELPTLWIPVSDFVVTPVLAWWHRPHPVAAARAGRGGARRPAAGRRAGRPREPPAGTPPERLDRRRVPGRGMLVWGFTAGVISTLLDMAGWARPWPHDRIGELPPIYDRPGALGRHRRGGRVALAAAPDGGGPPVP